jgi:hypothetical protein
MKEMQHFQLPTNLPALPKVANVTWTGDGAALASIAPSMFNRGALALPAIMDTASNLPTIQNSGAVVVATAVATSDAAVGS